MSESSGGGCSGAQRAAAVSRVGRALGAALMLALVSFAPKAGAEPSQLMRFEAQGVHRFHGDDPRFTIDYPWYWNDDEVSAPLVLQATAPTELPVLRVAVLDEPFWLPLAFATQAASTQLSDLGGKIEILSEAVTETADGGRVNVGEVSLIAAVGAGVAVRSLFVHRFHEGRWVVVNLTTADAGQPISEALRAIALSLSFPDPDPDPDPVTELDPDPEAQPEGAAGA